jgi:hypothetical protein
MDIPQRARRALQNCNDSQEKFLMKSAHAPSECARSW